MGQIKAAADASKEKLEKLEASKVATGGGVPKEVLENLGQIKSTVEASREKLDKLEQLTRSKTTSIYEEVGLLKGQGSQLRKDSQALQQKTMKTIEHLAAVQDGLAGSMAQIVATFSRPPIDSPGVARLVDTTLQQAEMLKELESHVATLKEAHDKLAEMTKEIKDKTPERPPYRSPPQVTEPAPRQTGRPLRSSICSAECPSRLSARYISRHLRLVA